MSDNNFHQHTQRPAAFPTGPLLKSIADLDDPECRQEKVHRLAEPRLVFADLEILRHDFPQLRDRSDAEVERWILHHGSVISTVQAATTIMNARIPITSETTIAYRPKMYGRALVIPIGDATPDGAGLIDVKGVGVAPHVMPKHKDHATGTMLLGEAIRDWIMQWVIEAVFWHSSSFAAVPLYGIIDSGFDSGDTSEGLPGMPSAIHLRRAHRRPVGAVELPKPGSPEAVVKAEIEMLLRLYGVTSSNSGTRSVLTREGDKLSLTYAGIQITRLSDADLAAVAQRLRLADDWQGETIFDTINVQLVREVALNPSYGQLVDFGHYSIQQRFELPLVTLSPGGLGTATKPGEPGYLQPIPQLQIPKEKLFGEWFWDKAPMHLAQSLHDGEIDRAALLGKIMGFLQAIRTKWGA